MNILKEIKYAYQRVVRGYDDTVYWSFDDYFIEILPAILKFCQQQLDNKELMELNPLRKDVFSKTVSMIKEYYKSEDFYENPNSLSKLLEYIGKNINYYWD